MHNRIHRLQILENYRKFYNRPILSTFQSVNKLLAKKLIDDKTRDYMNARRVSKVNNYLPKVTLS